MAMSKLPGASENDPVNTELEDILTCPICIGVITRPKTLGCFHSFCTPCIDEYGRQKDKGGATIPCPVCRHVTKRGEEPKNFLVNDILEWHKTHKTKNRQCGSCVKKAAEFACTDCKVDLCLECKENHNRLPILKNHRIIPICEQKGVVLDNLVFCSKHLNELIRFNCKKCESVLCIECKVLEHEGHETENIETAVKRLTPVMKAKIRSLKQVIEAKKEGVKVMGQNKEELIWKQMKGKEDLKTRKLEVIAYVDKCFDEMYKVMDDNQNQEGVKFDKIQASEENTIKEIDNVVQWANTMFDTAMNTSLLNACQGGMRAKLDTLEISCKENKVERDEVRIQRFFPAETMPIKDELFGTVHDLLSANFNKKYVKNGLIHSLLSANWKPERVLENTEQFNNSNTIGYINGQMWLPCPSDNSIPVYTPQGEFIKPLTHDGITRHRAVIEVNGDVILAADSGLHVLFPDGRQRYTVIAGIISDVCFHKGHIYALECDSIYCLHKKQDKWQYLKTVSIPDQDVGPDSLCVSGKYLFVSSSAYNQVMKLSMDGKLIQIYGTSSDSDSELKPGLLSQPYIGCIDEEENILVADSDHDCYQILDKSGQWSVVTLEEVTRPIDILFTDDNTIWSLCEDGRRLIQYKRV